MKKYLLLLIVLVPMFFFSRHSAAAIAPCTITINSPSPLKPEDKVITDMTISSGGISPNKEYYLNFQGAEDTKPAYVSECGKFLGLADACGSTYSSFRSDNGTPPQIRVLNLSNGRKINDPKANDVKPFGTTEHIVEIVETSSKTAIASCAFKASSESSDSTSASQCSITFTNALFSSRTQIGFLATNIPTCSKVLGIECKRRVTLKRYPNTEVFSNCVENPIVSKGIELGVLEPASYFVSISDVCNVGGLLENELCHQNFDVTEDGTNGGPKDNARVPGGFAQRPKPPCGSEKNNQKCSTAIGSVDVSSPENFIKQLFSLVLFIAGTGAVIIFIVAGYNLMTSAGDKQKVQAARDSITSAIVGLLFIIFSIVLLEIIGVHILQLPGFVK